MRCDKPKIIESLKHYTVVQASCGKGHTLLLTGMVHLVNTFIITKLGGMVFSWLLGLFWIKQSEFEPRLGTLCCALGTLSTQVYIFGHSSWLI